MARFSATVQIASPASGAVYAAMMAGTSEPISIVSLRMTARTALPSNIALARMQVAGVGTVTSATGIAHRVVTGTASGAAMGYQTSSRVETAWSTTPPTGPTGTFNYLRRQVLAGGATGGGLGGTGVQFYSDLWNEETDGPLYVEPGAGLLLLNVGSAPSADLDIHFTWSAGPSSDI